MKILKSNTKEVFCTQDPGFRERYTGPIPEVQDALHHQHRTTDFEFLRQFFPEEHRIFENFRQSYYFKVDLVQKKSKGLSM